MTNARVDISPYGQSVFAGAVDAVQSVDLTFDALINEIDISKMRVFLSDDIQSFPHDNVSALEKYAIEQATASKRSTMENKVDPCYAINQYQKPTVEQIYEEIAFVMGTFGYQIEDRDDAL